MKNSKYRVIKVEPDKYYPEVRFLRIFWRRFTVIINIWYGGMADPQKTLADAKAQIERHKERTKRKSYTPRLVYEE